MKCKALLLAFLSLTVQSAYSGESHCEAVFREAYVAYSSGLENNQTLRETYQIYSIYFDYQNGLDTVHAEVRPLLSALGASDGLEEDVLAELARRIQDGRMCGSFFNSVPLRYHEIVAALRDHFSQTLKSP